MKVLHLPAPVGNHGYSMAMAERRAGLESESVIVDSNKFNFPADNKIQTAAGYKKLFDLAKYLLEIRGKYDIYHFNFAKSLLDFPQKKLDLLDLQFYKGSNFFTFNGSDIRQTVSRDINPYTPFSDGVPEVVHGLLNKHKRLRLKKILNYAEHCFVLNPDLMRFFPEGRASFLPYIKFVWFEIERQKKNFTKSKVLRIVHAPTNRMVKGSEALIDTINELKKTHPVELVLVENVSYQDALKMYQSADIIVDQMRIGWYGGLALEAMKMGIPVACYINDSDLQFIPEMMKVALKESIININKDNLMERLIELIQNRDLLNTISDNGFDYVQEFHNPDILIKSVIERYRLATE